MSLSFTSCLTRPFRALLGRQSPSDSSPPGPGSPAPSSSDSSPSGPGSPAATSSSNSSNTIPNYRYDVFISFRGVDTRNTFVDHLYAHLTRKGIFVFKDDKRLNKGESISEQLVQAIQDSRVSIIVFSQNYASSTWCLEEMAVIADCKQRSKQIVFPVFYDVDPSHVRHQRGEYRVAFDLHRGECEVDPHKVYRWRSAMTDLANSAGWNLRNKSETEEIENIVQAVIKILGHKFSGFADDLIGIQPRVQALEDILKLRSKDTNIRVLGIWGMGGIGKTTHASALYDRISHKFEACCFIENVSKIYRDGGHISVQKQILRQTFNEKNLEMYSPFEISGIVNNRLHKIKVLIVLDNVDQLEQLQELAIEPRLLNKESRMVITTRDEHILKVYGAHVRHKVSLLNDNDARELFHRKAFKSDEYQSSSYVDLIPEVLKYVQCLPLAIRVMGSFLCTRDAIQWGDALDRFHKNPDNTIMDVLQISVEGLHDEEKEIFLHIACFFKEEREDYVKRILDCCGLHPHIGIPRIIEKSLITLRGQEIHMHDMLQELGKKIVRDEFPEEPRSSSRIWLYEDFFHVSKTKTGTDQVKAIVLNQKENISECSVDELSKMKNLRLLILYHKSFSGSLNFLSQELRYLLWHDYPFASLPLCFTASDLVELNMPNSSIEYVWEGRKNFPSLKRMDLSNSNYLIETPDFSGIPKLERLDLSGCRDLSYVHPSIGLLEKLAFLSFRNCCNLGSISFGSESNLSSLRVLHLSGCTRLENTPNFTTTTNLEYLDFDGCTRLCLVHESIGAVGKLAFLSLRDCKKLVSIPNSINTMRSLQTLDLRGCSKLTNLPLGKAFKSSSHLVSLIFLDVSFCNLLEVPVDIRVLRCLERLNLQGNNFVSIPYDSISWLHRLAYLNLSHCHKLEAIPEIPFGRASSGGRYFETVSGARDHRSGLYVFDCPKLGVVSTCNDVELVWLIRLTEEPYHFRCGFDIVLPWFLNSKYIIPWWFDKLFKGSSVIRIKQFYMDDDWIGFAFCVIFKGKNCPVGSRSPHSLSHPFYLSFESEDREEYFDMPLNLEMDKIDGSEHIWMIYISRQHCHFVKTGTHVTFKANHPGIAIGQWGMSVIYGKNIDYFKCVLLQRGERLRHLSLDIDFDYIIPSNNSSGPKFQLPYNWLVEEKDQVENINAKEKESNLSYAGL